MSDNDELDRDLNVLAAVYADLGDDAAEKAAKRPRTPERQAQVDAMLARAREALQAAREQAFADAVEQSTTRSKPVPASILAMTRDAVIARLREIISGGAGPQPALQFRQLDALPTEDLQRVLADLEQLDDDDDRS